MPQTKDKGSKLKPLTDQERNAVDELNKVMENKESPLTICSSCGGLFLKSRTESAVTKEGDKIRTCVNCCNMAVMLQRITMIAQLINKIMEKDETRIITP